MGKLINRAGVVVDRDSLHWRKSSGSGNNGQCVEVAYVNAAKRGGQGDEDQTSTVEE